MVGEAHYLSHRCWFRTIWTV